MNLPIEHFYDLWINHDKSMDKFLLLMLLYIKKNSRKARYYHIVCGDSFLFTLCIGGKSWDTLSTHDMKIWKACANVTPNDVILYWPDLKDFVGD